ncbi:DUF1254 domain-containing protein [Galbibacter pacificus]|uniref:DUF1254 domain-containing protein n=1 Tax=Galbibacter pacificus TaxID=2996052 RepID=A0ABT6FUP5_9FLAO|nr:DUF1254 domain-containing protein [Galbibacter pacificus]MDG3583545.1 DUF1254 domain-containing protein [Galbibacter pacificus]MDG3586979.1 DUF1254 domain-containing protein [Galbibacter pacificus]
MKTKFSPLSLFGITTLTIMTFYLDAQCQTTHNTVKNVETHLKSGQHTPADFNTADYVYKVSEGDFNFLRSLEKVTVNQWSHKPDVSYVKTQQVIRENQDVIYSSAVVDVSKGATISVPKGDTYHVIQILDMQNYTVKTLYPGKSFTVTPDNLTYGTHVYLNMRTRKKTNDKAGLEEVHERQRQAIIDAKSANPYQTPEIVVPLKQTEEIRLALLEDLKKGLLKNTSNIMGTPFNTDPQGHLYATAYGWGGLPLEDAGYLDLVNKSKMENGKPVPSSITFMPPKIDLKRGGFWSITTYTTDGWLGKDEAAISNTTATPNTDGTYTIYFNSPDKKNNVNTPAPFTALLRAYVPESKESIESYLKENNGKLIIE